MSPANLARVIRSLASFDDSDAGTDPLSLRNDAWSAIKETLSTAIRTLE